MKNRLFITIAALLGVGCWLLGDGGWCHAQTTHSSNIREKLSAFVESKEYGVHRLSFSKDGLNVYQFAQQFAIDDELGGKYYGPLFTPRMLELEKAIRSETVNAKSIYIHDASDGDSPLPGVKFQFMMDAQHPMVQSVTFDLNKNIRLISFEEPDGSIYALLLMWDQTVDQDKKVGDTFLMDGMIYEISGRKMDDRPFIIRSPLQLPRGGREIIPPTAQDMGSVEEFMAKVKRTCEIFQRETPQGQTAAGVVLNKTCNAFSGKLTKEQYFDLLSNRETDVTHAPTAASEITTTQVSKTIVYNSMLMNESVEKDMVECQISGITPLSGKNISVRRNVTFEPMGTCPVVDGKFSFTCKLPKNEICRIYLDDRDAVFFCSDGKPIIADMEHLTIEGGKASQKINDFLQTVERERLAELHETDIQKKAEINRQRGERLLKAVRENLDNIISACALSLVYTEMSYEELKPYLSDDYAFSHHILLAPMREYVEGLEKRRPGTPYTNLELVDTKGRPHQLSEYIGKGYVVLHFWDGLGGYGSEIHPSMKTLYETYRSRGVEFVTLAFSFGVQGWREEVKKQQLTWPQLMPDPDTNPRNALAAYGIRSYPELIVIDSKGTIVACPRNVDELSSVLKGLYSSKQ